MPELQRDLVHHQSPQKQCMGQKAPVRHEPATRCHRYPLHQGVLRLSSNCFELYYARGNGRKANAHSNPSIDKKSTPIFSADLAWRTVVHLWITMAPCDFRYFTIGPGLLPAVSNIRIPRHQGNLDDRQTAAHLLLCLTDLPQ